MTAPAIIEVEKFTSCQWLWKVDGSGGALRGTKKEAIEKALRLARLRGHTTAVLNGKTIDLT